MGRITYLQRFVFRGVPSRAIMQHILLFEGHQKLGGDDGRGLQLIMVASSANFLSWLIGARASRHREYNPGLGTH